MSDSSETVCLDELSEYFWTDNYPFTVKSTVDLLYLKLTMTLLKTFIPTFIYFHFTLGQRGKKF